MGNFLKPDKVGMVLAGRYTGRNADTVKNIEDGTSGCPYSLAMVSGIDRCIHEQGKNCQEVQDQGPCEGFQLQSLHPHQNIPLDQNAVSKDVKVKFEERYKTGKNKWFFQKLGF